MKFLEKDKLENKLKKKSKSIGILGGTFDPAHFGHVKLSSTARKKFKIDEIIWAVTKKNPFKKKTFFNLKKRINIAKKITFKNKYIEVCFFESRIKSNRTVKLINYLEKKYKTKAVYKITKNKPNFIISNKKLNKFGIKPLNTMKIIDSFK